MRAMTGFARGVLIDAEADARAAVEALPHRRVVFMPHCFGWLAQTLIERGKVAEAVAVLREAGANGGLPETFTMVPLLRARGALHMAQGDARGAAADAVATGRLFEEVRVRNPAPSLTAALALRALGEEEKARELVAEELERARRWGAPRQIGRSLRVLGLLEGGQASVELLREAARVLEGSSAELERAYALVELGAALRRSGKRIVTIRTVEMHLSNAYRKLGISSRSQLTQALTETARETVAGAA